MSSGHQQPADQQQADPQRHHVDYPCVGEGRRGRSRHLDDPSLVVADRQYGTVLGRHHSAGSRCYFVAHDPRTLHPSGARTRGNR